MPKCLSISLKAPQTTKLTLQSSLQVFEAALEQPKLKGLMVFTLKERLKA